MTGVKRAAIAACALLMLIVCAIASAARPHALNLEVELDPESRRFAAVAELASDGDFTFVLSESLMIQRATVNGKPAKPALSGGAGPREWRIPAPQGATLRIEYGGTLPPLDRAVDHRGVLKGLSPMASGTGTFLPAGSGWYPQPRGLFTYTVRLSLPGAQRGLVAGRLASESLPGAPDHRYVARFEFDAPTDGIDLMAGPYVVDETWLARGSAKPVRLRTYFFDDLAPLAKDYLADTARYIELYSVQIGQYPYEAFSVVASPLPTGFGMPTLTYIGERVLKLPFIRATSLGHEVLHNWWGNGVYPDSARGNWSEGLTTFMADYFYKERDSEAAAREMRQSWLRDFAALPADAQRPLTAFRSRTHTAEAAVGYGKAAMVFFMLRDRLGQDAFERGIRVFWDKHRFRMASWRDLQSAFEQSSKESLGQFFQQWVERAGGPRLTIADARARRSRGSVVLELALVQSLPAYSLRVPLEIVYAGRSEIRTIDVERERQTVTLQLNDAPEGVRVDPDLRLWRRLDRDELAPVLRQWIGARAPRLVVASADPAAALAAREVAQGLFESAPHEITPAMLSASQEPVLIAGLQHDVDALLASHGVPPRPALVERGSAEVWTVANPGKSAPIAVVSAQNANALKAVARALPHYGSQSYLVFDGPKVIKRGVWPAQTPIVRVTSEPER